MENSSKKLAFIKFDTPYLATVQEKKEESAKEVKTQIDGHPEIFY